MVRFLILSSLFCLAITIEEKVSLLEDESLVKGSSIVGVNSKIRSINEEIKNKLHELEILVKENAKDEEYRALLLEVNALRDSLEKVEDSWREIEEEAFGEEYAIWDRDQMTIEELVGKYGSHSYLYVIPPDIGSIKVTIRGGMRIPSASWVDLLEGVLCYHGIGIKDINPYAKQLFTIKGELSHYIFTERTQLELCDKKTSIVYLYRPPLEEIRSTINFLEKFKEGCGVVVTQIGKQIAIVGVSEEVERLVTLCDKVWSSSNEKVTKVVRLSKLSVEEAHKIVKGLLVGGDTSSKIFQSKEQLPIFIYPLERESMLILVGDKKLVEKALSTIGDIEGSAYDSDDMTTYWYTCKHYVPSELSKYLEKIYLKISKEQPKKEDSSSNFIADDSSQSILMIVKKELLEYVKDVVKRLDLPKRMVEIEILLCERRINDSTKGGINLLRIGDGASGLKSAGAIYESHKNAPIRGLFKFFFSGEDSKDHPAYDLIYNFLLTHDNVRVTAAPSVLTINGMPATISITDQISINTGAAPIETGRGFIYKDAFERADFGITIKLTPIIHEPDGGDIYVTLDNDISFENIRGDNESDRPDIHRRHVKNCVRVMDGQTIVIGGLRSKALAESNDKIPILGEIPGIGKFFGTSLLSDKSTEMFIFIKPKVVTDNVNDLVKMREEKLKARPGENDAILRRLQEGRNFRDAHKHSQTFDFIYGGRRSLL